MADLKSRPQPSKVHNSKQRFEASQKPTSLDLHTLHHSISPLVGNKFGL